MKLKLVGCQTYGMVSFQMHKGNVKEFGQAAGDYLLGQTGADGKALFIQVSDSTPEYIGVPVPKIVREQQGVDDDDGDIDTALGREQVQAAPADLTAKDAPEEDDDDAGDLTKAGGAEAPKDAPAASKGKVTIRAGGKKAAPDGAVNV